MQTNWHKPEFYSELLIYPRPTMPEWQHIGQQPFLTLIIDLVPLANFFLLLMNHFLFYNVYTAYSFQILGERYKVKTIEDVFCHNRHPKTVLNSSVYIN